MDFEGLLKVILALASIAQLYLSFIKGRNEKKDHGEILYTLSLGYAKRKFIAFLYLGLISYFIYIIVTGFFTILGVLIVLYLLLSIYDFSKLKIVTSKGIGQKSLYSNSFYNFTNWSDIVEWRWSDKKTNLLIFKIEINNKYQIKDWEISSSERGKINELFTKYTNGNET